MKKFINKLKRQIKIKIKSYTEKQEKKLPRIIIDSSVTLYDLLEACDLDHYDPFKFNDINFPQKFSGDKVKVELAVKTFRYKNKNVPEEIIELMNKQGFRPITLYEMLTLVVKYPTFCKSSKYAFTALGSKFNNLDDESITAPSIMILAGMDKKNLSLRDWSSVCSGSSRCLLGVRRLKS
ncbi:MAG: hypothetical protein WCK37_02815 [Candidatus Falkowbacteria bacterium]